MPQQDKVEKAKKLLNSLSKEELVRIIVQVAEQDDAFHNSLLVKYGKGDPARQIQSFRKQIDSIVNKHGGRARGISYRAAERFSRDMFRLLDQINDDETLDEGLALEMSWLVLAEGIEAFEYADDSGDDIGTLVQEALNQIREIADEAAAQEESVREEVFLRLLTLSDSVVFQGWEDYQIALFSICVGLADTEKRRERLKEEAKGRLALCTGANNDASGEMIGHVVRHVRGNGSAEEARRFEEELLHFPFYRELAIRESVKGGNYSRVIDLAEDGERRNHPSPAFCSSWTALKYDAYKKLSRKPEQLQLAKELLLQGEYAYYAELESLLEGDMEELYRDIIAELRHSENRKAREVYVKLIEDKQDLGEMLVYASATPAVIENYASRLYAYNPKEVERIYSQHLYESAAAASNRKAYQNIRVMLVRYKQLAGEARQSEVLQQLKTRYSGKRAFLEVLSPLEKPV